MFALVDFRESFRAFRHYRRGSRGQANLWSAISGSALQHVHESLSPRHIRLVQLMPGRDDDQIACILETVSLDDDPDYEALSYTWANPDETENSSTRSFHVNDAEVDSLPNLSHALHHLRHPDKPRRLWIDYLCINQLDVKERNAQVQMMGSIYQHARQVICWVGLADDSSAAAIKLLSDMVSDSIHFSDFFADQDAEAVRRAAGGLRDLLERPWFHRIWTVQEVAVAREAVLVCGRQSLPWSAMRANLQHIQRHWNCCTVWMQGHDEFAIAADRVCGAALRSFEAPGGHLKLSLLDMLRRYTDQHATDPRDHIYGLLGMLDPSKRSIKADYSVPQSAVFRRAAVDIMRHESDQIDYLLMQPVHQPHERHADGFTADTPSWVADFADMKSHFYSTNSVNLFSACGLHQKPSFHVINEETVAYDGVCVDIVAEVDSGDLIPDVNSKDDARSVFSRLSSIEKMVELYADPALCSSATGMEMPTPDQSELDAQLRIARVISGEAGPETPAWFLADPGPPQPGLQLPADHKIDSLESCRSLLSPQFAALFRVLSFGAVAGSPGKRRRLGAEGVPTFVAARRALATFVAAPPEPEPTEFIGLLYGTNIFQYSMSFVLAMGSMRFFTTKAGRMGMGPASMQKGDRVVVFKGGRVPFLVRPQGTRPGWTESRHVYSFLGPVYLDGCMDGEAVRDVRESGWRKVLGGHAEGGEANTKEWTMIYLV